MNTGLTELVFILDRSGSMGGLESDTIGGFNGMIKRQKSESKQVNVTTVLLIAPVTFQITKRLKVNPYPYLIMEIFASNIGGTATLIGDPPNILIGSALNLSFMDFVYELTPIVIMTMIVLILAFESQARHTEALEARLQALEKRLAEETENKEEST